MDPREYLSKQAFGGHRQYQPLRRLRQMLTGSGGLQVDSDGRNVSINQREPEPPKKAKANCCPEEVPYTLDFAWQTWIAGKGVLPDPAKSKYVRKNISDAWKVLISTVPEPARGKLVQRPKSRPFCVRFVWVCSCEDEVVCDYEALNGDSNSLIDILRPHVAGEKCTSQLYAIEFFGFRVRHNPKPPTYTYHPRSNAYVIYRLATKAHTG